MLASGRMAFSMHGHHWMDGTQWFLQQYECWVSCLYSLALSVSKDHSITWRVHGTSSRLTEYINGLGSNLARPWNYSFSHTHVIQKKSLWWNWKKLVAQRECDLEGMIQTLYWSRLETPGDIMYIWIKTKMFGFALSFSDATMATIYSCCCWNIALLHSYLKQSTILTGWFIYHMSLSLQITNT